MLCLDASYIVNVISDLLRPADALAWDSWLEQRRRMISPHHMRSEVTNALHKAWRRGQADQEFVDRAIDAMLALPIEYIDDGDLAREAIAAARDFALPATYDAFYLALAARHQADLMTSDRKLWQATRERLPWVYYAPELVAEA